MNREALLQSLGELRRQLELHEQLLREQVGDRLQRPVSVTGGCRHQRRLCQFLIETAEVLEGTRKAFKSKQLEALRKECLRVLAEEVQPGGLCEAGGAPS